MNFRVQLPAQLVPGGLVRSMVSGPCGYHRYCTPTGPTAPLVTVVVPPGICSGGGPAGPVSSTSRSLDGTKAPLLSTTAAATWTVLSTSSSWTVYPQSGGACGGQIGLLSSGVTLPLGS